MLSVIIHYPTNSTSPVGIIWWDDAQAALSAYYLPDKEDYFDKVSDIFGYITSVDAWANFIQHQLKPTALNEAFEADIIEVSPREFLQKTNYDHRYRASKIEETYA